MPLTACVTPAQDEFGNAAAIFGNYALIGAAKHDGPATDSGAVYVFERTGTGVSSSWNQISKLTASDAESGDTLSHYAVVSIVLISFRCR